MTDVAFETVTQAQATAIAAGDRVLVATGAASRTSVLFQADGSFAVTIEARTVVFGPAFGEVARSGGVVFADGSKLYVGTAGPDTRDFDVLAPSSGVAYAGDGADVITTGAGAWLLQGNQGDDRLQAHFGFANTVYGGQGDDVVSYVGVAGATPRGQFGHGNRGADTLTGQVAGDTLLGGQGDDRITGLGGEDVLNGNLGNDDIFGTGRLFGEGGDDSIQANNASDNTVSGGDGDDLIFANANLEAGVLSGGRNLLSGDLGDDTVTSSSPQHDQLQGGDGNDLLRNISHGANAVGDLLDGGVGADTLLGGTGDDTLVGGDGVDSLDGGIGDNRIEGGGGDESLTGRAGADTLMGGDGADSLDGGGGENRLDGGHGNDLLTARFYSQGHALQGGDGADSIFGGSGGDTISGGDGNDVIADFGGLGNRIDAGVGDDRVGIVSGGGTILGGDGADTIDAINASAQSISGGAGNDNVRGTRNADTLAGDAGDDLIDVGTGADVVTGGSGSDRFQLLLGGSGGQLDAAVRVLDWSSADRIEFAFSKAGPVPGYAERSAADFNAAVAQAELAMPSLGLGVVAVQVGADVLLFTGNNFGGVVSVGISVRLVACSLDDISGANIFF